MPGLTCSGVAQPAEVQALYGADPLSNESRCLSSSQVWIGSISASRISQIAEINDLRRSSCRRGNEQDNSRWILKYAHATACFSAARRFCLRVIAIPP
jgi:hypothetical protein